VVLGYIQMTVLWYDVAVKWKIRAVRLMKERSRVYVEVLLLLSDVVFPSYACTLNNRTLAYYGIKIISRD